MRLPYIHLRIISTASYFAFHDTRCADVYDAYTGVPREGAGIHFTALHSVLRTSPER